MPAAALFFIVGTAIGALVLVCYHLTYSKADDVAETPPPEEAEEAAPAGVEEAETPPRE